MSVEDSKIITRTMLVPIVRIKDKIVLFSHVPKCGGTAISRYLRARFGSVAFLDEEFLGQQESWSKTSPQHIASADIQRLFPESFFDFSFAMVRHPVSRVLSEFYFLRDGSGLPSEDLEFSQWLSKIPRIYSECRWAFDNHLRPMYEIVPPGSRVFKLEYGLNKLVQYLDDIAGNCEGPRHIEPWHEKRPETRLASISNDDITLIEQFYAKDYERFGYERNQASA